MPFVADERDALKPGAAFVREGGNTAKKDTYVRGNVEKGFADTEEVIANSPIDQATARKAAESAMKKAVPLAQNGYKVALFRGLI